MKITFSLDTKSINKAKRRLRYYKNQLPKKCKKFVEELAYKGIFVGATNTGEYGKYILFSMEITEENATGAKGIMYAEKQGDIIARWIGPGASIREAVVNPLLMAEFGSGAKASDEAGKENARWAPLAGSGRGTFPGQIHANEDMWYWMDLEGNWQSSSGTEPKMPVFQAYIEMKDQVESVARKVFKTK